MCSKASHEEVLCAAERILEAFPGLDLVTAGRMLAAYFQWENSEAYYFNAIKEAASDA